MTMQTGADEGLGRAAVRQSFVDRDSHFNGAYTTPNDLRIDGHYEGEIECEGTLIVAESADVNARIVAGNISVAGQLQGEIGCRGRFEILPSGRVGGRVVTGTIVVHEGARYDGELRMRGEEPAERGLRPAANPARRRPDGGDVPSYTPLTNLPGAQTPPSGPRANGRSGADEGMPKTSQTGGSAPTGA